MVTWDSRVTYGVSRNEDGSKSIRVPLMSILAASEKVARRVVLERLARGLYSGGSDLYERMYACSTTTGAARAPRISPPFAAARGSNRSQRAVRR